MTESKWRRWVGLLLSVVLILCLAGCGTKDAPTDSQSDEHNQVSETFDVGTSDDTTDLPSEPPTEEAPVFDTSLVHAQNVAAGYEHSVALKADGTVVATGKNEEGECDIEGWSDVISVYATEDLTLGIRTDGSICAVGINGSIYNSSLYDELQNLVAIDIRHNLLVGIKDNGSAVKFGTTSYGAENVSGWSDLVGISTSGAHTVGVQSDGNVVAVGYNAQGQCDVSEWTDIEKAIACNGYTVGLKNDGTIITTILNQRGNPINIDWKDIVDIDASDLLIVAIKSDGTVEMMGRNSIVSDYDDWYGPRVVPDWTNIVEVNCNSHHVVGVKTDGTVVALGEDDYGQCDVSDWSGIKVIEQ